MLRLTRARGSQRCAATNHNPDLILTTAGLDATGRVEAVLRLVLHSHFCEFFQSNASDCQPAAGASSLYLRPPLHRPVAVIFVPGRSGAKELRIKRGMPRCMMGRSVFGCKTLTPISASAHAWV